MNFLWGNELLTKILAGVSAFGLAIAALFAAKELGRKEGSKEESQERSEHDLATVQQILAKDEQIDEVVPAKKQSAHTPEDMKAFTPDNLLAFHERAKNNFGKKN